MIQRIQSLYLLLAIAFVALFLVMGDAWRVTLGVIFPWLTPVAFGLALAVILAAGVALGLFRNRALQRKVVLGAQWMDLALVLVLVGTLVALSQRTEPIFAAGLWPYLTLFMPFVAYILLRLAARAIDKDIALVRSMDRLR
jgi:hypothetical protein